MIHSWSLAINLAELLYDVCQVVNSCVLSLYRDRIRPVLSYSLVELTVNPALGPNSVKGVQRQTSYCA